MSTDQPPARRLRPTPFAVFLASIGTCAGIYVLGFCQQRGLPTEGMHIVQRVHSNPFSGMVENIDLEIQVPPGFPEKYHDALIKSAAAVCGQEAPGKPAAFRDHDDGRRGRVVQSFEGIPHPRRPAPGFDAKQSPNEWESPAMCSTIRRSDCFACLKAPSQ